MAHPDKSRGGSEKGQREHAGKTSQSSDAGMQRRKQGIAGGDDTPAGGQIFPEAHRDEGESPEQGMDRNAGGGQPAQAPKTSRGGQKSHAGKR